MMTYQLYRSCFLLLFLIGCTSNSFSQSCATHSHDHSHQDLDALKFVPNHNQWHPQVKYKVNIGGINALFLEENALTYLFHDQEVVRKMHDSPLEANNMVMSCHAYKVNFLGANTSKISGTNEQSTYHNYFLGNDPSRWAGKVPVYEAVIYEDLYPNIQMKAYSQNGYFKYDFILEAGANSELIQMQYDGTDGLSLVDGNLQIRTSIEQITEQKPYAFQIINGHTIDVDCKYVLSNNTISFDFPNGYNKEHPLIIDPVVVAATLSGSTSDNWGFTATYDNAGNVFAGGVSFGPGFPTTLGAFQNDHAGGNRDIAVTKYNPDGSQQIFATYIGGTSDEQPHSMIVDFNGQLCIYGTTSSSDYPTLTNAVQPDYNGSTDIIITKLNADGSDLVGSTFLGGSATDGLNTVTSNNYDSNKGEIVLDPQGNIYIASSSSSTNFPTTPNALQTTNNGQQDAIVVKLNSDLSTLFWSTYIGTSSSDSGMGLRVKGNGKVIIAGIAGSAAFPVGANGYEPDWPGGNYNAYILQLSTDGQTVEIGTYFGTSDGQDSAYFVDLDEDDNVHIYGQTTGTVDITPNTYFSNPGSKQFLAGFNADLSDLVYSTVIGNGPDVFGFDLVPVAFMVDKCNGIYFSAFQAQSGLPTTADAIDVGDNYFYLAKLSPNAEELDFGTYYGDSYHVDGGTSRFDKAGIVYQAVCSCSPGSVMATLPNAYSDDSSPNCSIGVFKIDFEIETVTASAFAAPATSGCAPLTIDFQYTGADAETFFWDFGTGDISIEENPTYTFENAGTYEIMQVVNAPNTCNQVDTFFLQIDVLNNSSTMTDTAFCPGNVNLFLDVSTANAIYEWQDGNTGATYQVNSPGVYWVDVNIGTCVRRDSFVVNSTSNLTVDLGSDESFCDVASFDIDASNPDAAAYEWSTGATDPSISVDATGLYIVTVYDSFGCFILDSIDMVFSITPDIQLGLDTTLCEGETTILTPTFVSTGANYVWQDGSASIQYTVTSEGLYWAVAENDGCFNSDSLYVSYTAAPAADFDLSEIDCYGDSTASIEVINPTTVTDLEFLWSTGVAAPDLMNLPAGIYQVTITDQDGCTSISEFTITQPDPLSLLTNFENVECFGEGDGYITIDSVGGGTPPFSYSLNGDSLTGATIFTNLDGGLYTILAQDANDCTISQEVDLYEPPQIFLSAGEDKSITLGDSVRIDGLLFPDFNQVINWTSEEYVNCIDCIRPYGIPLYTADFVVTSVDSITGCTQRDTMRILVNKPRNIYIPNVFSPNGDGVNDLFFPFGDVSVEKVNYFRVYDRWGEQVHGADNFQISDPRGGWDGRLKGEAMNPGVFAYIVEVEFVDGVVKRYKGDVTVMK